MIRIENLTHIYNKGLPTERVAIDNINLEINKGEIVGIIGHTGSGKSTLIQHFNGLIKPTSGNVYIDGVDIFENKKVLRNARFDVGLVFQYPEYQLFEENVFKDIAFGPKNMGLNCDDIKQRVIRASKLTGVTLEMLDKSPFELSGGEQRRVAIAGVIAMEPKILVLDEPAAGLDPIGRREILSQIKAYQKEKDATIILVSHSMEDIAEYTDRVIVLNDRKIFDFDTTENIFKRTKELREIGLEIPHITNIMETINKTYKDINGSVFTVENAKNEIMKYIKRGQND